MALLTLFHQGITTPASPIQASPPDNQHTGHRRISRYGYVHKQGIQTVLWCENIYGPSLTGGAYSSVFVFIFVFIFVFVFVFVFYVFVFYVLEFDR